MTTSALDPALAAPDDATASSEARVNHGLPAPLARRVIGHALLLGVAGDALLGEPRPGLGFPIFVGLVALGLVSLTWSAGRDTSREVRRWLAVALLFAAGVAWRDGEELQFFDIVTTLFSLGMAAVALRDPADGLLAERMRDTVWGAAAVLRRMVAGIVPLALNELYASGDRGRLRTGAGPVLRAAAIGGAILFVFGSLLRSADPVFASLVALPDLDLGSAFQHVVAVGFFAWVAAGWARGALAGRDGARRAPDALPFQLGMLDVTTALGTLGALFAAFVLAQLGWLFGGESFLRERTGMTAAEYARGGFFQMVWVVLLVVPVLVATRAALRPGLALERRHTALSLPVIGLLGVMIFSAVARMRLYVHYYGLTTDRFYPLVFMGWLALVLAWLAVTVLRSRGRPFAAGAVVSGLATLAALNVESPDAIVARVNLTRATRAATDSTPALDLRHLTRLGGEAADVATAAVLLPSTGAPGTALRRVSDAHRCAAATELLDHWGPAGYTRADANRPAAWRFRNAGEARAERVVGRNAAALWRVRGATCARAGDVVVAAPVVGR